MADNQPVKKFYGLAEANQLVPQLSHAFIRLFQMNHQLHQLMRYVKENNLLIDKNHLELDDSMDEDTLDTLSSIKILLTRIQKDVDALQAHGIKIKSLEHGIVNIPAKHGDDEFNFYWEVGDNSIVSWLDQNKAKRCVTELD